MDVEQCLAATVPLGLVSSTLLYGSATSASASASASGEDDEVRGERGVAKGRGDH